MNIREAIAEEITGQPVGSGYYQSRIAYDEALEQADSLLASEVMRHLRRLAWIAVTADGGDVEGVDDFWHNEGAIPDYIKEWVMSNE